MASVSSLANVNRSVGIMLKFENAPCVLKGAMAEIQRSESMCDDYVNECCVDALELLLLNLI